MDTLSTELKSVIARRLERADSREILAIASAICAEETRDTALGDLARFDETSRIAGEMKFVGRRFVPAGDDAELVHDRQTGLIWTKDNVGSGRLKWKDAVKACEELVIGGFDDWRLPTVRELLTLVDYERHEPAICPAFDCESAWYWTSTPYAPSPGDCAWLVGFGNGGARWGGHDYGGFVRAVRAGQ